MTLTLIAPPPEPLQQAFKRPCTYGRGRLPSSMPPLARFYKPHHRLYRRPPGDAKLGCGDSTLTSTSTTFADESSTASG